MEWWSSGVVGIFMAQGGQSIQDDEIEQFRAIKDMLHIK